MATFVINYEIGFSLRGHYRVVNFVGDYMMIGFLVVVAGEGTTRCAGFITLAAVIILFFHLGVH